MLPIGTNPWFGDPVNPLDAALIPGGSSSGSAVAVATGEADVALGTDTGGSVRIPAACCGVTGLKTTWGRVSLDGVWPLASTLDTVGPIAATVDGLVLGMQLLEPGFQPTPAPATTVGRLRTSGDPQIEAAIDAALRAAELEVVTLDWDGFDLGAACFTAMFFSGVAEVDAELVAEHPDDVGADVAAMVSLIGPAGADGDEARLETFRRELFALFDRVQLLALPTLPVFPPRLDVISPESLLPHVIELTRHASLFNAAGTPATAQPVPVAGGRLPASLQLVGPRGGEELLLATAAQIEHAVG
jgi:amidase